MNTSPAQEEQMLDFETLEPLELLAGEQPEEYLCRMKVLCEKDKHGEGLNMAKAFNVALEGKYAAFFERCITQLPRMQFSQEKFGQEKNDATYQDLSRSVNFTNNGPREVEGEISYAHTNTTRTFFGKAARVDNVPYVQSLFCMPGEGELVEKYIAKELEGKKIMVLGGGESVEDLIVHPDIHPAAVVNIDPYLVTEKVGKGKDYPYMSVPVRAENTEELSQALRERQLDRFDEMWASYSVPYYLSTPDQIKGFFGTIKAHLNDGGVARITPISIKDNGTNDAYNELMKQVKDLLDDPEYNVYIADATSGGTLFIRKLKKS